MTDMIKRILCLVLSLTMAVFMMGVNASADETDDLEALFESLLEEESQEEETEQEFVASSVEEAFAAVLASNSLKLENKNVLLVVDKATGCLYVKNKKSGKLWSSNPYDASADTLATGITRTNLSAQFIVKYIEDNDISSTNNFVGSTNRDGAVYSATKDTIRADYTFVNEEFTVPIEYSLTETGFNVSVLFEKIKDTNERRVHQIEVLPYFGAAGLNETGYMLIPDGSGALVELNNGKQESFPYEKDFYGGDRGKIKNVSTTVDKNLLLPVYGMKVGANAFLANVVQGAETASLYACVAGKQSNYNRIYTYATYRNYDTVNLSDAIGAAVYAKYTALEAVKLPAYTVSFSLLSGNKADYVGMAEATRTALVSDGLKETDDGKAHLFVDFYGATQKEKAFLGIRYTGVQKLTTFAQAEKILKELKDAGIDAITVGYRNFSVSDYKNKLASNVTPAKKLGGKKAYKSMLSFAKDNNIRVYPYADFVTFQKNGNGYWSLTDVIMGLELSVIKQYPHAINDGTSNKNAKASYFVAADRYNKAKNKLLKTLKKYGSTGVLFDESSNYIYNDFSPKGYQADRTVSAMQDIYEAVGGQSELLLSAPNAYALKYASSVTDLPMTSSQYVMFDSDVPFIQLVLKGVLPYSSEALNVEGLSDTTLLKLLETGSQPKFALIYEEGKQLIGTELDHLYGATYSECKGDVATVYKTVAEVQNKVSNSNIKSHKSEGELVTVEYSNGVKIYLNYGKTEIKTQDGKTVSPQSYTVVG